MVDHPLSVTIKMLRVVLGWKRTLSDVGRCTWIRVKTSCCPGRRWRGVGHAVKRIIVFCIGKGIKILNIKPNRRYIILIRFNVSINRLNNIILFARST